MEKPSFTVIAGEQRHQLVLDGPGFTSGTLNGETFSCDVYEEQAGRFQALRNNVPYSIEILGTDESGKTITLLVNGRKYTIEVRDKYDELLASLGMDSMSARKVNELKAPMPGLVLDVLVKEGSAVKKGDPLVVLEAMKMENILKSPTDATIGKVAVTKGTAVEKNQLLLQFA